LRDLEWAKCKSLQSSNLAGSYGNQKIKDEAKMWSMAGAKFLSNVIPEE
jgi:hypothetical protein